MATQHLAVISQTAALDPALLAQATAAIQKQVTNDFGPIWDVTATVDDFATLDDKPLGYWPVVIRDDIHADAAGVHLSDDTERVFALVTYREDDWTLTLSHEVLEMLVDPFGVRFPLGPSPAEDGTTVEYLAEVCDPCRDVSCGYRVNDVLVSDFVVPAYYNAFGPGRYDFAGHITRPRQLLAGGYYTWRNLATREWWYTASDGDDTTSQSLGLVLPPLDVHLRGAVDRRVAALLAARGPKRKPRPRARRKAARPGRTMADAARAQAAWWQAQIDRVRRA
jgi:hypothetical protein